MTHDLGELPAIVRAGDGDLLAEVVRFVRRYVVMTHAQLVATALWVAHTHAVMAAEQTPYLLVTSPEKQCGKTRLLEVLQLLVARPWPAILPSEAVVYRYIDRSAPTLLLDEVDTIFNPRSADKHEGLRALLNAGNRRGARVPRCVGTSAEVAEFDVYSPKALAGIGTLPDTITDRSLPVRLRRRSPGEKVRRFRRRRDEPRGRALHDRLATWAREHDQALGQARPTPPEELSDRMQDACEPLLAIADRCGDPWPELARQALIELCTGERPDDVESMRLRLLRDTQVVFGDRRAMPTERLLERLVELSESPWGSYYGRKLEARDLAALLRHYGIKSTNVRYKSGEGPSRILKSYRRQDLIDAWQRYT